MPPFGYTSLAARPGPFCCANGAMIGDHQVPPFTEVVTDHRVRRRNRWAYPGDAWMKQSHSPAENHCSGLGRMHLCGSCLPLRRQRPKRQAARRLRAFSPPRRRMRRGTSPQRPRSHDPHPCNAGRPSLRGRHQNVDGETFAVVVVGFAIVAGIRPDAARRACRRTPPMPKGGRSVTSRHQPSLTCCGSRICGAAHTAKTHVSQPR